MIENLKEKLKLQLSKPIIEESHVVYILSRLRKILDVGGSQPHGKFQKLRFYCDWALHTKIDRNTAFQEEFIKFIQGDTIIGAPIFTFEVFQTEFLEFLSLNDIPAGLYINPENNISFRKLLAKIYAETPIIVTIATKFQIKTNEGIFTKSDDMHKYDIGYEVKMLE